MIGFRLTLRALRHRLPVHVRLRQVLKRLLRTWGFRSERCETVESAGRVRRQAAAAPTADCRRRLPLFEGEIMRRTPTDDHRALQHALTRAILKKWPGHKLAEGEVEPQPAPGIHNLRGTAVIDIDCILTRREDGEGVTPWPWKAIVACLVEDLALDAAAVIKSAKRAMKSAPELPPAIAEALDKVSRPQQARAGALSIAGQVDLVDFVEAGFEPAGWPEIKAALAKRAA